MIASLDDSVGRVMQTLDELGVADNTVLIFASDNGGVGGYEREALGIADITDNAPLRHGKGSLYEGGTRVPFIVRWPGRVTAGASCAVPAMHVDLFPTLLEITGAARPENHSLDGQSLMPWLLDATTNAVHGPIYQHFPGYLGASAERDTWRTTPAGSIQSGDWKLLEFFEDGRLELYHLKGDLGETNNLAAKLPAKAKELHAQLAAWRAEIKAPMPTTRKARRAADPIAK
jgi:arylsulfatase A-like enzyme